MARTVLGLFTNFRDLASKINSEMARLEYIKAHLLTTKSNLKFSIADLENAYESSYLRLYLGWETFIEQSFLRYMCGFSRLSGQKEPVTQSFAYLPAIAQAESLLLNGRNYILWHDAGVTIARINRYFLNSNFELVIASSQTRLNYYAAVRHRIAHSQKHARGEFDLATMALASRRYPAGRPGRFLRDINPAAALPETWLATISKEFVGLSQQICS